MNIAPLSDTERQFLTFALSLAADEMASRGDEFGSDDDAALARLSRLAAAPDEGGPHVCSGCRYVPCETCPVKAERETTASAAGPGREDVQ